MSKTLRIFTKDVRHLWPEILLYLSTLAAYILVEPWTWARNHHAQPRGASFFIGTVNVFIPLCWWILVARAVQDESLVGDRQFWLTRPYGWHRLLIAKLLFIVTFVSIPLCGEKLLLLHVAHLPVVPNIYSVLLNVACTIVTLVLVLLTLSTISATLIRMLLFFLGGAAFIALMVFVDDHFPGPHKYGPDSAGDWTFQIGLLVCVGIVVLQYARRRTTISRLVLAGVIVFAASYSVIADRFWNPHRAYSDLLPGETFPLLVALDASGNAPKNSDNAMELDEDKSLPYLKDPKTAIRLLIPVAFSGIPANLAEEVDNVALTFAFPGQKPISAGNYLGYKTIRPGGETRVLALLIDKDMVHQYEGRPITIRLTLAVTELEKVHSFTSTVEDDRFKAPYGGNCYLGGETYDSDSCQFPIGNPPRMLLSAPWPTQPCEETTVATVPVFNWSGSDSDDAFTPEFDPVVDDSIYWDPGISGLSRGNLGHLCNGTSVTFTEYRTVRRKLMHITLPQFRFGDSSVQAPPDKAL